MTREREYLLSYDGNRVIKLKMLKRVKGGPKFWPLGSPPTQSHSASTLQNGREIATLLRCEWRMSFSASENKSESSWL